MSRGMLVIFVIPAILVFVFCVWVFYSMVEDVSQRGESFYELVGEDTARLRVEPPE